MGKLPTYRRINKQDYNQDQQQLVEKLALSINNGFDTLYDMANNKITLNDNISATVIDVDVSVDAAGVPTKTTVFKVSFDGRVGLLLIGKSTNLTNSQVFPTQAPFITYTQNDNIVTIQHITGLQVTNTYRLKLVAFKE